MIHITQEQHNDHLELTNYLHFLAFSDEKKKKTYINRSSVQIPIVSYNLLMQHPNLNLMSDWSETLDNAH